MEKETQQDEIEELKKQIKQLLMAQEDKIIIKTPEQIAGIRKSCQLAAQALDHIRSFVKEGVTTNELNDEIARFTEEHGAISAPLGYDIGHGGYPKETCISLNEVVCHGIPSERKLKDGDILNIDVTTILDSYYGDTSRMFTVGKISPEAQNLIDVTRECLATGIKQVRPGRKTGRIGWKISEHADKHGYGVVTMFCGHGVGIKFHERPSIRHRDRPGEGDKMQEGMIFTIEPMINQGTHQAEIDKEDKWTARTIDGKLSAQFEHTILVTKEGHEILTLTKGVGTLGR